MKITGNFETPAFTKLYCYKNSKIKDTMKSLANSDDKDKRETYEYLMEKLKEKAETRDIVLKEYTASEDGKRTAYKGGVSVCEIRINEDSAKQIRHLGYSKDFCNGIRDTLSRLNKTCIAGEKTLILKKGYTYHYTVSKDSKAISLDELDVIA